MNIAHLVAGEIRFADDILFTHRAGAHRIILPKMFPDEGIRKVILVNRIFVSAPNLHATIYASCGSAKSGAWREFSKCRIAASAKKNRAAAEASDPESLRASQSVCLGRCVSCRRPPNQTVSKELLDELSASRYLRQRLPQRCRRVADSH